MISAEAARHGLLGGAARADAFCKWTPYVLPNEWQQERASADFVVSRGLRGDDGTVGEGHGQNFGAESASQRFAGQAALRTRLRLERGMRQAGRND